MQKEPILWSKSRDAKTIHQNNMRSLAFHPTPRKSLLKAADKVLYVP
jgi:hypothetical protein